ncbi:menaquinone biosynthetic enzyme MqnA/MqnD family protein [Arachidicoccus sp.]|uniref:menaquinone biosynthetic enzyme MqnA/MqnD family protein n=1 Tax=Arachidicoccus sp. TaxID=1872624 RepID=UPI003D2020E9
MEKIRVAAVSYLNTKPLLYGIKRDNALMQQMDLIEDYPSKIGQMLVDNEVDMGLIPVAFILQMSEWHIYSDYCIGSVGPVETVCLFSDVPIEKIEKVLLDYQSFSSVNLCKVLLKNYWKKEVVFEEASDNYIDEIGGTTAGVIIGDRVFEQKAVVDPKKYIYDLADEWTIFTGLPFLMAAWIANKVLPQDFIEKFNVANKMGLDNLDMVIAENPYPTYDLYKYFTQDISFTVDEKKLQAMELFLKLMKEL